MNDQIKPALFWADNAAQKKKRWEKQQALLLLAAIFKSV